MFFIVLPCILFYLVFCFLVNCCAENRIDYFSAFLIAPELAAYG